MAVVYYEAIRQRSEAFAEIIALKERIAALEGELRDYERSMEKANVRIENLKTESARLRDPESGLGYGEILRQANVIVEQNNQLDILERKLLAVERENRDKCLELAEKAFEIRELRGVVDAAAAFVNSNAGYNVARASWKGDEFNELRKRLDALDLPDDAPRPEPEPVTLPQEVVDLMAALKASLEYCSPGTVVKPHTGAPGNSVDTRVEREPEP